MKFKITINNLSEARGAFNGDRFKAHSLAKNIYTDEIFYSEGMASEVNMESVPENERGGIVTFSTDLNSAQLSQNRFINFIKQKFHTVKNRLAANRYIDKLATKFNLVGWTITNATNCPYSRKSIGDGIAAAEALKDSLTAITLGVIHCEKSFKD